MNRDTHVLPMNSSIIQNTGLRLLLVSACRKQAREKPQITQQLPMTQSTDLWEVVARKTTYHGP